VESFALGFGIVGIVCVTITAVRRTLMRIVQASLPPAALTQLLLVIFVQILVMHYRDRPLIRAASIRLLLVRARWLGLPDGCFPFGSCACGCYSQVIHAGLILCFLSAPFIAERNPTLGTCQLAVWLLCAGFTLTFAPLFAQSWYER
jgi:hypothetical protein